MATLRLCPGRPSAELCLTLPMASQGRALAYGATGRERCFTKCCGRRGEPNVTLTSLTARSLTPGGSGPPGLPRKTTFGFSGDMTWGQVGFPELPPTVWMKSHFL